MKLNKRLEKLVQKWRKLSKAYRLAQDERDPSEEEWWLNDASAEAIEKCVADLENVLAQQSELTSP